MKERRWSKLWAVALSVALTVTMLPDLAPKTVSAVTDDSDYSATPEAAREITTGMGDERTWKIDWSDEFNGASLDNSKWSYMIGTGSEYSGDGWGNNEQEYYTKGENAEVSDGNLKINARKLSDTEKALYGGKSYTSTRLWTMDDSSNPGGSKTTRFSKTYGRIESRIKITSDAADSTGLWPAFWMMPSEDVYGTWAASGEIDIMEIRGRVPGAVDGTIHYGSMWPNNKSNGGSYNSSNTMITYDENFTTSEYHTYAIEWLPGEICWYIDDQLYYKTSNWFSTSGNNATDFTYPAPFNQNFYILLNLAVGGNYDGGALSDAWNNAEMDVDYVRVYDLVDSATGELVDYSLMEQQVVKPVDKADDTLVSGTINDTNYVASDLSGIKATTAYPTETENIWYLATMLGGTATTSIDGDALKVDVTAPGTQNYSVQLIHNVPLTKGYRYVMTFEGKADVTKSLGTKYGNIAGYPAYADSYSVDLTADWKSYTYTFDMTNKTDATGRIELNLGLNSGACYFKNLSVICTGLTPTMGENDAKTPLANGNHVYNGTFDQGTGRYFYWNAASDTNISVDKAACELQVVGTSDNSKVYQKGMNLLGGDTYQVSLDAKSATPGDITVKLVSNNNSIIYTEKTIHIDSSYTLEPYTFDFTINAGVTDTQGIFEVITGNNTVFVDNITMIRTSNNNLDWTKVDFWPLYNGDFFNGDDGWNIWSENAGFQSHTVKNGVLEVHSTVGANADFWCVGTQSSSMAFIAGIPYKFTVHLNGSKDKTIKVETPDAVQKDYNFVAGDNAVSIEFKPNKDLNGKFSMYFGIGEGAYDFTIDSVDVEVDSSKIAIPTGYAKPAGVTSAGNVRVGNPILINYSDEVWASKITAVYVDGTAINSDAITVNHNKTLTIASNTMPAAGNYSIKFDAEGYVQTKAITQTMLEASGNLITNGSFDTDLNGWTTYFADWNIPNGTAKVQEGKAVINVVSTESHNWDCQLKQEGIDVEANDYYILQFDASSSVSRPIQLEFGNLGTASQTIVNLTNITDTYYIVLSGVAVTDAASILFMTGNVNGCLEDFPSVGAHSINFDNVKLYAATKEQVDALQNPTITLSDAVFLGNDIVLNYTQNNIWEANAITISLNGKDITSAVTVNEVANTITIDKAQITQAGTYDFIIKADGFKAITTTVKVLSSSNENLFAGDWTTWVGDGDQGTLNCNEDEFTVDFAATINSQWNTPEFWSMQAKKLGITTFAGKEYKLTFDAELLYDDPAVTENRGLVIEMGAQAKQQVFTIKPGTDSYEYVISPGTRSDFYVLFLAGGNEFNVKAHTLNITNIKFTEVVKEPEVITLAAPQNISAVKQPDVNSVLVEWNAVTGAAIYSVYRSDSTDGSYTLLGSSATNSYNDTGLNPGTYFYKVIAVPEAGSLVYKESTYSSISEGAVIPQAPVKVTGVTLDRHTLTMVVSGAAITLHANVLPAEAAGKEVLWSSSNEAVVTVNNGTVIAVTSGSAIIVVTTQDGGYQDSCNVTVEGNSIPIEALMESITASNGVVNIVLDKVPINAPIVEDFILTVSINSGTAECLQSTDFHWDVATRTATINVTDLGQKSYAQNVIVTAAYQGTVLAANSFYVEAAKPAVTKVTSITVSSNASEIILGGSLQMNTTVLPADATDSSVLWSVENGTGSAVISTEGVLTTTKVGSVIVRATAKDGSGVYGTKVITIKNKPSVPDDNNSNTPTPEVTTPPSSQVNKDKGLIKVELSIEDTKDTQGNIVLPISTEDLKEALTNSEVSTIVIAVTLPKSTSDKANQTPDITLSLKVLQAIKESNKDLTISFNNSEGKTIYSWTFDVDLLASSDEKMADVNIGLERLALKDAVEFTELNKDRNLGEGVVMQFSQVGLLPSQARVRVYIGDMVKSSGITKVYLYRYNKETGKLETLPYSSKYVVDAEGYVSINIVYGSDYVALLHSADEEAITSLRKQITVAPATNTLFLSNSKKKLTSIKIELPPTLEVVENITDPTSQSAIGGVTVTYSSSKKDVATVDKNGKIKAVGKGTTVITTEMTLYSGKMQIVKTVITVK